MKVMMYVIVCYDTQYTFAFNEHAAAEFHIRFEFWDEKFVQGHLDKSLCGECKYQTREYLYRGSKVAFFGGKILGGL